MPPAEEPPTADSADVDRRVLRRALAAGLAVTGVVAVPSAGALIVLDAPSLAPAAVLGAATLGVLVAAAWVLVSVAADALAGGRPSGRRLAVGLGLAAVGFVAPVLVLAALAAA